MVKTWGTPTSGMGCSIAALQTLKTLVSFNEANEWAVLLPT